MGGSKLGLLHRLLLPTLSFSSWLSRQRSLEVQKVVKPDQYQHLLKKAEAECAELPTSHIDPKLVDLLFSPKAMLSHPLLIHFIRPAVRMATKIGHNVSGIPIITSPALVFAGRAERLDSSNLRLAEIPLGTVMLLRELGLAIINLHNAIEYREAAKIQTFARVCSVVSALLFKPAPIAFQVGQVAFKNVPFSYKIYASQAAHVLGVFLILHELAHICLNHQLDPIDDEQCCQQEYEADIFAMECQFSPKKGISRYEPFRKLQMIFVCNLFSIMDKQMESAQIRLEGYPAFKDRRQALLDHFGSDDDVRRSVKEFETAIRAAPEIDLTGLELPESR